MPPGLTSLQDTPESGGISREPDSGAARLNDLPLAAGSSMRKLVLPELNKAGADSAALWHSMPASPQPDTVQQTAEYDIPVYRQSDLVADFPQTGTPAAAEQALKDRGTDADMSASPEVFSARTPHGRGNRSIHVLADSDDDSPVAAEHAHTGHEKAGRDADGAISGSPEIFTARRQHGQGTRAGHALADSDSDSPADAAAAAPIWASDSSEVGLVGLFSWMTIMQ